MLASAVILEFVQSVARRQFEIIESVGGIDHQKLRQRALLDVDGQLAAARATPNVFGFSAGECDDHNRKLALPTTAGKFLSI